MRSIRQATVLLMSGGAIPASKCTLSKFVGLRQPEMIRQQSCRAGVTVCPCMRFACVIRSGYLVLANQHTSSEGQGSRDLRQTRVEPY